MNKSFEAVDINIQNDIKHASNKKINEIYNELKQALKLFDKDPFFKNAKDYFKGLFANKRRACLLFLNDLYDSKDKLTDEQREQLRQRLNKIADIYRTLGEDIIRFLGYM